MIERRHETPGPIDVDIRVPAGRIEVDAGHEGRADVDVRPLNGAAEDLLDRIDVRFEGGTIRVEVPQKKLALLGRSPEFEVVVRCPGGSRGRVRTASADVESRGRLGGLDLKTASGDTSLGEVEGDVRVDSASGDVSVEHASGRVEFRTASGDLHVRRVEGDVKAQVVSGDLHLEASEGRIEANSVSGDLRLDRVAGGPVLVNSVSGDVEVRVVPGAAVWLDLRSLSGDTSSELASDGGPAGDEQVLEIRGKTVSGDVRIARAS